MSAVNPTIDAPTTLETPRRRLLHWAGGGAAVAAILAAGAIALWPASVADQARDDGERFGQAAAALYDAQSPQEVDAALADMNAAALDSRDHVSGDVNDHINDQADALTR